MANIDWGMIGLGALVGVGCRKQLRAAGRIAASTAASLAGVAAKAASDVAEETKSPRSAEEVAADAWLKQVDQRIAEKLAELGQSGQGRTGGKKGN